MTTPIQIFQKLNKEDVRSLAIALSESWMQRCLLAALAQIATMPMSTERLAGANILLDVLHKLTVEGTDSKTPPSPTLPTYDIENLRLIEEEARKELQKPLKQ